VAGVEQQAYRALAHTVEGLGVWMDGTIETSVDQEFRHDLVEHELEGYLHERSLELLPGSVRVVWGWTFPLPR
jgi:hypothetical protein